MVNRLVIVRFFRSRAACCQLPPTTHHPPCTMHTHTHTHHAHAPPLLPPLLPHYTLHPTPLALRRPSPRGRSPAADTSDRRPQRPVAGGQTAQNRPLVADPRPAGQTARNRPLDPEPSTIGPASCPDSPPARARRLRLPLCHDAARVSPGPRWTRFAPNGVGRVKIPRDKAPASYNPSVKSDAVSQNYGNSGTYTRTTWRPHGARGPLVTLGLRISATVAQAAVIAAEIGNMSDSSSETSVSDKNVIANPPTNTSGFSTYITQAAVTPAEI